MLRPYFFSTASEFPASDSLPNPPQNQTRSHTVRSGSARSGQVAVDTCATTYFSLVGM
jgi:hypothetical protein